MSSEQNFLGGLGLVEHHNSIPLERYNYVLFVKFIVYY